MPGQYDDLKVPNQVRYRLSHKESNGVDRKPPLFGMEMSLIVKHEKKIFRCTIAL